MGRPIRAKNSKALLPPSASWSNNAKKLAMLVAGAASQKYMQKLA